jgi:O-antigen/teichoic acid export membrane protein
MWSMLTAFAARGINFASVVVVARLLGPADYGALAMILSTTGLFHTIAGFGLGLTATKHIAELRERDRAKCGAIMALSVAAALATGLLTCGIMAVSAGWLAEVALGAPELEQLLRYSSLMLVLGALNGVQIGMLSGFEAFRTLTFTGLFASIAGLPLVAGGTLLLGLDGAVGGSIASLSLACFINRLGIRRVAAAYDVRPRWRGCWRERSILWQCSLPTVLSAAAAVPAQWLAGALLVNQPGGYAAMGEFSAANSIRLSIIGISGAITQPLAPILATFAGAESRSLSSFNVLFPWFLGVAVALPLVIFPQAPEVLFGGRFGGPAFRETVTFLMIAVIFFSYTDGVVRVLLARNLMWWGFYSNMVWSICLVCLSYILVGGGSSGIGAAYAGAYCVNAMIVVPLYLRRGVIPRSTLVSAYATVVWVLLAVATCSSVAASKYVDGLDWEVDVALRLFFLGVTVPAVGWLLYRLAKRATHMPGDDAQLEHADAPALRHQSTKEEAV